MYRGSTVGVVVPAYNEAEFVGDVLRSIPAYVDRVLVVDDASTDGTWREVLGAADGDADARARPGRANGGSGGERAGAGESPATDGGDVGSALPAGRSESASLADRVSEISRRGRLHALRHDENRGAGAAVKTGYLAAMSEGIDVVATIDGDGQMDPAELSALLDPVVGGDAEYAKGNRLLHRNYREEIPPVRLVGNAALTGLTKVASGYWTLMDPQNGFTAISSTALEAIDVDDLYEDYGYLNDLLIRLNVVDVPIADVPVSVQYSDERSDIQYSSYVSNVSALLLTGFLWRLKTSYVLRDFHPLVLFYLSGAVLAALGLLGGVSALRHGVRSDDGARGRALYSGLLAVTGYVCLLFGMTFDRRENSGLGRHCEPDGEPADGER